MKPQKTWIVLADAEKARIIVHDGPGKGLYALKSDDLRAEPVSALSDAPGMMNAPKGPNRGSVSEPDLKGQAEEAFAKALVARVADAHERGEFHAVIFAAAPHMLGCIRQHLPQALKDVMRSDIAKDLTHVPLADLPAHLGAVLAV